MRIYSMNRFYLILLKISLNSANEYRIHKQKLDTDEFHIFFTHSFILGINFIYFYFILILNLKDSY